jgi:hypothetical protein
MYSDESRFDKQGKYFWSLVKGSGWSADGVRAYMIKTYSKTHYNLLSTKEKRQMINIMKSYVKKAEALRAKKVRQQIAGMWVSSGYSMGELHSYMVAWGFGDSMRKLTLAQVLEVQKFARIVCSPQKKI